MIIFDGKKLAEKIKSELKKEVEGIGKKLRLAIVLVGGNTAVSKFISEKQKFAKEIGVDTRVYPFDTSISTNELRKRLSKIVQEERNTGVVVQLPLPDKINTQYILNSVTPEKDVDVLSSRALGDFATGRSDVFPPVAGAIKLLLEEYSLDLRDKYAVILGAGRLVGKPSALWLLGEKANFSVLRSSVKNPQDFSGRADIIISGIGRQKFLTGDMVKDGVMVFDAGTSESEGKLSGDIDFDSVSKRASYITPVPGGIGPLTVALLFKNLVTLAKSKE